MRNKVLIVDDDITLCELGKEMFEIMDVEAASALTLEEAVEHFTKNHESIGLVIFDLNLEEVTGIDVFKELQKIDNGFVGILTSGVFIEEDAKMYKEIGFKDIILKPYNMSNLKSLIAEYLS